MRAEDLSDYVALRRIASNAWEIVRFRKRKGRSEVLTVRMRDGRSFEIRGGTQDFHVFHRIFLRDEYRLGRSHRGLDRSHSAGAGWGCVVDLGANVGLFALRAARVARRVVSYEPFPGNVEQLRRNARVWPEVELVPEAVAGKPGTLRLYRPKAEGLSGLHSAYRDGANLTDAFDEVPATTLDQLFERHQIADCELLKIDVEGAEYDILYAASDATFARIRRIYGEYHNVRPEDPSTRIAALSAFLGSKGFDVELAPKQKDNLGMFYAVRRA